MDWTAFACRKERNLHNEGMFSLEPSPLPYLSINNEKNIKYSLQHPCQIYMRVYLLFIIFNICILLKQSV